MPRDVISLPPPHNLSQRQGRILLFHSPLLGAGAGLGLDLCDLPAGRRPVRSDVHGELAQTDAEQLQQPRLPRVEQVALLADGVALAAAVLLADHDLAADHARGHAQPAELGLDGVAHGDVVLGGHLAARAHDLAGRDGDGARGVGAGARKVGEVERREVVEHGLGLAVGEQQADGARDVLVEAVDVVQDGLLGRLAQGAGHEGGLSEEDAVSGFSVSMIAHIHFAPRREAGSYRESDSSCRTSWMCVFRMFSTLMMKTYW